MAYVDEFAEAMIFLKEFDDEARGTNHTAENLKHKIEEFCARNKKYYEDRTVLVSNVAEVFIQNSRNFANLCHYAAQSFYERWTQLPHSSDFPLAITIGSVSYKGKDVYTISKDSIRQTMLEGFCPNKVLNVHVWLTLPNMQVLDLSIIPTLNSKGLAQQRDFGALMHVMWQEDKPSDFVYTPILQHNNFMYAVDAIKPN